MGALGVWLANDGWWGLAEVHWGCGWWRGTLCGSRWSRWHGASQDGDGGVVAFVHASGSVWGLHGGCQYSLGLGALRRTWGDTVRLGFTGALAAAAAILAWRCFVKLRRGAVMYGCRGEGCNTDVVQHHAHDHIWAYMGPLLSVSYRSSSGREHVGSMISCAWLHGAVTWGCGWCGHRGGGEGDRDEKGAAGWKGMFVMGVTTVVGGAGELGWIVE
ncbi:hypothetical protein K439DRAFT_1610647 [Ramaria rubella]|nr:hypothetical protein K439DRAFT_1610647 [Ramaria rubella]